MSVGHSLGSELDFELFIEAIDDVPDGLILFDPDDKLLYCNKRHVELFPAIADLFVIGTTFEKIVRTSVDRGLVADALGCEEAWIAKRMAAHRSTDPVRFEQTSADGTCVEIREKLLANGCRIGFRTDITERKKTELALRESEARMQSLLDAAPLDITLKDLQGRYVRVNRQFASSVGIHVDSLLGKTADGLVPLEIANRISAMENEVATTGNITRQELEFETANGFRSRLTVKFPVYNAVGEIDTIGTMVMDISALKRTEKALQKATQNAEDANQAKSEFLSAMSHELRTPLHAILGFSHLLSTDEDEPLSDEQSALVAHISSGGNHLLKLVNEVLDLARVESGQLEVNCEAVNAGSIIDNALTMARPQLDTYDVALESRINISLPTLWVDHLRATQVILNLLSNAIKYNRADGQVWLDAVQTTDQTLRITISDTGNGIAEDKQTGLFQPFNRLGVETTEIEGSGIGLALSKKITEAMKGTIGFHSVVGEGSQFWIDLPVFETPRTIDNIVSPAPHSIPDISKDKEQVILYVEDNEANLVLMGRIISRLTNLSMISAHTAERGLEIAEEQQPDIIILDINLPGMNGFEALEKLKSSSSTRDIPVLALSADAMPGIVEQGLQAGFVEYLTKPVDLVELRRALSQAIGNDHS
jgi:PAS domain S-box-containing protein